MALQMSVSVRNGRLDAIENVIGVSPTLEIRSGPAPADCAAADSGTVLATLTLPSDWMASASGGSKTKSGTWSDPSVDATGTAAHFRIKASGTCHMQGTVGTSATDMVVDNTSFNTGQPFTINSFTISEPNG